MLKELDMISITDHNSLKQYETLDKLKDSYDFLLIYGVEVTVSEGFHVLAYFERYEQAMEFNDYIKNHSNTKIMNIDDIMQEQIICDIYDQQVEKIDYKLNQKIDQNFDDVCKKIRSLDGLIVIAHINRSHTGILDYYQDFSMFDFDGVEIYSSHYNDLDEKQKVTRELLDTYPYLCNYRIMYNSDSHDLENISEKINYIELKEKTFNGFKEWLKNE
ncbi:MAG: PHP domain-containing protein [Bacilli bacterium]